MVYMFVFGPAIITVRYWADPDDDATGGARVEVRRAGEVIGAQRRGVGGPHHGAPSPGTHGGRAADGVIWRCDLPVTHPGGNSHHRRPSHDGDGGLRMLDTAPSADPVSSAIGRLADLSALLVDGGATDIADQVDPVAVERALPAIRSAILACLDQAPPRRTAAL